VNRVLVTGGRGQLAYDLRRRWHERHPGDELVLLKHDELDVTDADAVGEMLRSQMPRLVINCAAYHVVDEVESSPEKAFAVNAIGPRNLALACKEIGAVLVHLSTDYVFSGDDRRRPHIEDEPLDPPNVYGVSKASGEMLIRLTWPRHFIVRGSGLYGVAGSSGKGGNFVETMLKLAAQGKPIKVVNDQVLTPTSTWFLADQIAVLVTTEAYGTYHATCQGECSWFEFAGEIFQQAGLQPPLEPTTSTERVTPARRPPYSVLENRNLQRLGIDVMPHWKEALRVYLAERHVHASAAT
jgi:dTDP-4-dehydrorhamnose reductase